MKLLEKLNELGALTAKTQPGWTSKSTSSKIEFPKLNGDGFSFAVEVADDCIQIQTDTGWHCYYYTVTDTVMGEISGLARDLLTTNMRIREMSANGSPYRWYLEVFDGKKWLVEDMVGLIIWNYFGRKTERTFQNNHLPPRTEPLNQNATDAT